LPRDQRADSRFADAGCFLLEAIDPEMNCATIATRLETTDTAALKSILGDAARDDPELGLTYHLTQHQLADIVQAYDIGFALDHGAVTLRRWHFTDGLPYLLHTGYELPLMLEGRKPLAVFSDVGPVRADQRQLELLFDRHVANGSILKREVIEPFEALPHPAEGRSSVTVRIVLYAIPGQVWRMEAFLLLHRLGNRNGWNDIFERLEGALLGYED
jgi:hypothetical protein